MSSILIVGAGGFMGSHFAEAALRCGHTVWAGVRASTSRRYLTDERLKFVTFDFDDADGGLAGKLADTLRANMPDGKPWDYVIYNLGATKCLKFKDFNTINYEYLRAFTEAVEAAGCIPRRFLYMSSLSVMGPGDERGYAPFTPEGIPMPDTRYGASKLKAEMQLRMTGLPFIIFRCTGIYGPRDHDYFLMLKSLRRGFDFSAGLRTQRLTFIYGPDLAEAAMQALEGAPARSTYIISEPRSYTQKEFRRLAARALGIRHPVPVTVPLWMVKVVSTVAEKIGVMRGKPSTLNRDKYHIMRQRNWQADISAARDDFGFNPPTSLPEGLAATVEWCRREHWL